MGEQFRFAGYANNLANVKRSDFPAAVRLATDEELAAFDADYGRGHYAEVGSFVQIVRSEQARRAAK